MKTRFSTSFALAALLIFSPASTALSQVADHDAHHPEAQETRPGAGMMDGGMMGMMADMMRGMMGEDGQTMPQGMMGMMGMCPMMQSMMSRDGGMMGGMGMMDGHGWLYGIPGGQLPETTPQRARAWLERQLEAHGNPRLRVGAVEQQDDGTVVAEIETVDGSLVQRLAFNRYPSFVRQANEQ